MSAPNPSILAKRVTHAQQVTAIVAETVPTDPAVEPANVIKAKTVKAGQIVRAWLKGEARGGEYTVKTVTRSEDGASVHIEFEQPCQRPDGDYKAAYRFYVVKDVEAPEPKRKPRRKPAEHLTHQPFAGLKELI